MHQPSKPQLHQALTQFSSAVLTMEGPDDLQRLVVTMWVELGTLGLDVRYCGINVFDHAQRLFNFYGVHEGGLIVAENVPFEQSLRAADLPDLESALKLIQEQEAWQYAAHAPVMLQWLRQLRESGVEVKGPDPSVPMDAVTVLEVPFSHGTIQLVREAERPFTDETIAIVQSFGQILSFGYARYEDLKKLEQQNRELRTGLAVDRVHVEVLAMANSHDWAKVVNVMRKELLNVGVKFAGCAINIIDESEQMFRQHIVLPSFVRKTLKPKQKYQIIDDETDLFVIERPLEPGKVPSAEAMEAWRNRVVLRRLVDGEERKRIAERSRATMGFEISPADVYPRCLLDIPFSHGLIALTASNPDDLTEEDEAILRQMAQAISVAYTRFVDFQELERKNQELQEAQTQLVQAAKLAAMGQLVAGVAHEINTPLGTINSNFDVTERILKRMKEHIAGLEEDSRSKLSSLADTLEPLLKLNQLACSRIVRIVRDLKNFARLDEAEFKEANLNEDIESTLTLIQHELKDRIQVVKELGPLPAIPCYPNRLNQVFMNLLINACQSINGRGEIRLKTWVENQHVCISISDTGSGIKKEHLERIFDPGFTTKGVGVGTGLGLSISAQIVRDHQGKIEVQSEVGKGTTFVISLPFRRRANTEQADSNSTTPAD
ncbi:MAG: ATP-binding protein [Acidobacteriota bacterium]